MAHHRFVKNPDGTWSNTDVPTSVDFQRIDDQLYGSVNGEDGGVWSPATPIVIGGAGIIVDADVAFAALKSESRTVICTGAVASFVVHPFASGYFSDPPHQLFAPLIRRPRGESETSDKLGISTQLTGTVMYIPLDEYLHNRAVLSNVRLHFAVQTPHSDGVPVNLPTIKIMRREGNHSSAPEGLRTSGVTQTIASPSSGPDWYRVKAVQHFDYACNANNVIVKEQYLYYAVITEESGTNAFADANKIGIGNQYMSLRLDMTSISDLRPV